MEGRYKIMIETNQVRIEPNDVGLAYVKPETVKHGEAGKFGFCSWGQDKSGKWYSINYWPKHSMNGRGFNAEIRWTIESRDYEAFKI